MATRETPLYLQLARKIGDYRGDGYANIRIVSATASKPLRREPGSILISLKVQVPDEAFDERRISATVDVPLDKVSDVEPTVDVEVV